MYMNEFGFLILQESPESTSRERVKDTTEERPDLAKTHSRDLITTPDEFNNLMPVLFQQELLELDHGFFTTLYTIRIMDYRNLHS